MYQITCSNGHMYMSSTASTAVHITLPSAHHWDTKLSSSRTCTVDKNDHNHRGMTNQLDAPETMAHVGVLCTRRVSFRGLLYASLEYVTQC